MAGLRAARNLAEGVEARAINDHKPSIKCSERRDGHCKLHVQSFFVYVFRFMFEVQTRRRKFVVFHSFYATDNRPPSLIATSAPTPPSRITITFIDGFEHHRAVFVIPESSDVEGELSSSTVNLGYGGDTGIPDEIFHLLPLCQLATAGSASDSASNS